MNIEMAIQQAIRIEIENAVQQAIENAKKELETRIPEIVAGLAIKTMEHVSLKRLGSDLVISVEYKGGNKQNVQI